jgi:hypothetical protein
VWAFFVVVADPITNPVPGFGTGFEGVQIEAFVFEGSPEPLDHPIVDPVASTRVIVKSGAQAIIMRRLAAGLLA